MKTINLFILLALINLTVSGTAQMPNKILYNGEEYHLHSDPMTSYFEKHPNNSPKDGIKSTGLWRGYVATFEIKNNQLYLKDIEILKGSEMTSEGVSKKVWESVLDKVFPNQEEIKVSWYSGLLTLPYGKVVYHDIVYPTHENYILLGIENGNLIQEKRLDYKEYEEFRKELFQTNKITKKEYRKFKRDFKKKLKGKEAINAKETVAVYINKKSNEFELNSDYSLRGGDKMQISNSSGITMSPDKAANGNYQIFINDAAANSETYDAGNVYNTYNLNGDDSLSPINARTEGSGSATFMHEMLDEFLTHFIKGGTNTNPVDFHNKALENKGQLPRTGTDHQ